MTPIETVIETFQKWLYLPDPGVVSVALGTVAANLLEGRPVWTMLVGAPSSGKTQVLDSLHGLPNIFHAATLTESSLLSGTPKREKAADARGGLLRAIGEFGILVCKDFTSILTMNRDARAAVLSALREVYDGAWTRHVGSDGGRELNWKGKLGFLGGVTPVIDEHHSVMASMGERFLIYRLPETDPEQQAFTALKNCRRTAEMTAALSDSVKRVFAVGFSAEPRESTCAAYSSRLVSLATLVAHARSAVLRDGRTREVELVPDSEMPARLALGLAYLDDGMTAIGIDAAERWRLVCKVGMDCIPKGRRRVLVLLQERGVAVSTPAIAEELDLPTPTVRIALQDLTAHHVLTRIKTGQGNADLWTLSEMTRNRWEIVGFPDGKEAYTKCH